MASIATSNIVQLTFNFGRLEVDGFPVEAFRITGGWNAGDTALITPNRMKTVKAVFCGAGALNNMPLPEAPQTNVTLTMGVSAAATAAVDCLLIGFQRN